MLDLLEQYLREHWPDLPGPPPPARRITFLAQATGITKACFFVFRVGDAAPSLVVKVPRSPIQNDTLRGEVTAVERLRRAVSEELRGTLPGPIHTVELADHVVAIEPFAAGRLLDSHVPLGRPLEPARAREHVARVSQWLLRLHVETAAQGMLDDQQLAAHFLEPLETFAREAELTSAERGYVADLLDRSRALRGRKVPLCPSHGDLRPGNILLDGERLVVLDWEFSRPIAPPLHDWFTFVLQFFGRSLGLPELDGPLAGYQAAVEQVFLRRNWFSELVADHTAAFCRALGVDRDLVPLLLGMALIANANKLQAFLTERAQRGYLYLLRDAPTSTQPYRRQIRRQAFVSMVGELAARPAAALAWSSVLWS